VSGAAIALKGSADAAHRSLYLVSQVVAFSCDHMQAIAQEGIRVLNDEGFVVGGSRRPRCGRERRAGEAAEAGCGEAAGTAVASAGKTCAEKMRHSALQCRAAGRRGALFPDRVEGWSAEGAVFIICSERILPSTWV